MNMYITIYYNIIYEIFALWLFAYMEYRNYIYNWNWEH